MNIALTFFYTHCSVTYFKGGCPILDYHSDTSIRGLLPLPPQERVNKLLNTTLLLHTTSFNGYSARTRALLFSLGKLNEKSIVSTLKNPDQVVEAARRFGRVEHAKEQEADSGKPWRAVGTSLGAVAGGILIGITGGLGWSPFHAFTALDQRAEFAI